jgi:putative glycosyltransferase (TIGR04372 family)
MEYRIPWIKGDCLNLHEPQHYTPILERLVRKIWREDKYFVVVPCTFFLGHLFWEIIAAVSLARRTGKTLVLLKPRESSDYHVVNSAVFECELDCQTEKKGIQRILMESLHRYEASRTRIARAVAEALPRFLRVKIARPARRFHRCGIEESNFVLAKVKGLRNYFDLSVLPHFDPSIRLTQAQRKQAEDRLQSSNVSLGRWIAVAHVRESSFRGSQVEHDSRNFSQHSLLPIVRIVAAEGGTVVRLGTSHQSHIPQTEGLFDYAHSGVRSDLMDMYLMERARFYFGASSGPLSLAWAFGKPAFIINVIDFLVAGLRKSDMFIPKMIFNPRSLKFMSLSEYCSIATSVWDAKNYWYVENRLEDIESAFMDFRKYIENGFQLDPEDKELYEEWIEVRKRTLTRIIAEPADSDFDESFKDVAIATLEAPAIVAPSFLRKYFFNEADASSKISQRGVVS